MIAKTIIDSDAFIEMPGMARLLYYDLSIRADDDGFVNAPKKIMRMIGAGPEDLQALIDNKFIIQFDNGVIVIKHWLINNYIRKDAYRETVYKEEKSMLDIEENGAYRKARNEPVTDLSQTRNGTVTGLETQDSIGKDNKYSEEKERKKRIEEERASYTEEEKAMYKRPFFVTYQQEKTS